MDKSGAYYHIDQPEAGSYRTAGAAGAGGCSWTVLADDWNGDKSLAALARSQVDHGETAGRPGQVTLQGGQYFVSYGCQPWKAS